MALAHDSFATPPQHLKITGYGRSNGFSRCEDPGCVVDRDGLGALYPIGTAAILRQAGSRRGALRERTDHRIPAADLVGDVLVGRGAVVGLGAAHHLGHAMLLAQDAVKHRAFRERRLFLMPAVDAAFEVARELE